MAQTTGHMTSKHAEVEISPDNAGPWTDISGSVATWSTSGGGHRMGDTNTFGDHIPVSGIGKREAVDLTLSLIYTETASEAYDLLYGYFESQDPVWVRITPDSATANYRFKGRFHVARIPPPDGDANAGDILTADAELHGNQLEWQGTAT